MNELIKNSIKSRKDAIVNAYQLSDEQQKEVDDLFVEIEKLGQEVNDVGDFETKFAASPLNEKYINLFTKIATENAKSGTLDSVASGTIKNVAESTLRSAVGASIPTTKAAVHQEVYDKVRDIPGISDALSIKQHVDFFNRFRKKGE